MAAGGENGGGNTTPTIMLQKGQRGMIKMKIPMGEKIKVNHRYDHD